MDTKSGSVKFDLARLSIDHIFSLYSCLCQEARESLYSQTLHHDLKDHIFIWF